MTTDELIEAFGGRDVVMEITGAARNAVNNWRHDGVPYKHWKALIEAAEVRGVPGITLDALESTRPARGGLSAASARCAA
jgi:hypothetical protein